MESKLPKLSTIKRNVKNVLPTDRIRAAPLAFGSASIQPLSKDIGNLTYANRKRERPTSPIIEKVNTLAGEAARAKLRRSRSACDLRDISSFKRTNISSLKRSDISLPPIPAKTARIGTDSNMNSTVPSTSAIALKGTRTFNLGTNPKRDMITKTVATNISARNAITSAGANKKSTISASTSTIDAGKPMNKRIPPYDFKARFHDLLEKHKALKEEHDRICKDLNCMKGIPEQLEESQAQLFTVQEKLKNEHILNECLQRQIESQTLKIDSLTTSLCKNKEESDRIKKQLETKLERITNEYTEINEKYTTLEAEVIDLRERTVDFEIIKEQLFKSHIERKELHNMIMDMRGNIRVFCRVRPPLESEMDKLLCGWNYVDESTVEIQNCDLTAKNKTIHTFNFDQVFHPNSLQEDIFELVSPLIQSALDGYNVCIFAYGQTGSGKTYTMDGEHNNLGVIPRTVDLLFESINNYKRLGWIYEIKVNFLEIYNEVLYDLLSNDQKEMDIRMAKNNKNDIYVTNITEEIVITADYLRQLMEIAKMNRATASTVGNERSSRSHAVTKISLIGKHAEKCEISLGTINLVDLAGSESPKTSTRMNETKNINRSLSELTNVILALLQKNDHIPYRNSKLTHLLMPSLGGNSKTLMFINVAPFNDCFVESLKSLRFAASVNSCKMTKAKRNRILNTSNGL